ncbi:COG3650 family protein [Pacificimonas flava]|uniref:COG3650 family protein n=1 Tax=Pacificimonas flava TaxID=1234595 RepID=UPI00098F31DB|nr:hypothetical protein [Pacificimonas flava]MBB5280226.1 putative membrane protein [Pacificimonas flava]
MPPKSFPSCALLVLASSGFVLSACNGPDSGDDLPGDEGDTQPFHAIAPSETLHALGTEPFWSAQVAGDGLRYETPAEGGDARREDASAAAASGAAEIAVTRFAGRNGVSWSGTLDGQPFALAATPAECSDGMSDRTYPYFIMLTVRGGTREGCGWTDRQPYSDPGAQ